MPNPHFRHLYSAIALLLFSCAEVPERKLVEVLNSSKAKFAVGGFYSIQLVYDPAETFSCEVRGQSADLLYYSSGWQNIESAPFNYETKFSASECKGSSKGVSCSESIFVVPKARTFTLFGCNNNDTLSFEAVEPSFSYDFFEISKGIPPTSEYSVEWNPVIGGEIDFEINFESTGTPVIPTAKVVYKIVSYTRLSNLRHFIGRDFSTNLSAELVPPSSKRNYWHTQNLFAEYDNTVTKAEPPTITGLIEVDGVHCCDFKIELPVE